MNLNKLTLFRLFIYVAFLNSCSGQHKNTTNTRPDSPERKVVGGFCDGCELMYIGIPQNITSIDTSSGWKEYGQQLMVTGKVLKLDGKTPAKNVILYYWQTDTKGYYSPRKDVPEKASRHGHVRGWVKTNADGKYTIYTNRPTAYPDGSEPAHIHISIKEPNIATAYYIDDLVFDDDIILLKKMRNTKPKNRGGSGILRVLQQGSLQIAEHNIILGLNIPNYPSEKPNLSGLAIGEDSPSFMPFHAWGPDKGSTTCPVCKYGRYHGLLYFVGNLPNWEEIKKWLRFLEQESLSRKQYLKVYFIYGNELHYHKATVQAMLEKIGKELGLTQLALTFVPSFADTKSEAHLNKINPDVSNTFVMYKHRKIVAKFVDLKPNQHNFELISRTLNATKGNYFNLFELPNH
ncbi:dioxygenase family protein [Pedobacter insulae]|uniref:Protocatechuate 3,4-dioxygenase beta subunit n=1 Tax=Pedobacter insulae TaxID=414048 RepID=A0A1I2Y5C7_9SPHI|nr:intradiol ring-cleavage dioxygenase [Pedobacter insulae]SFH20146.1 protocatechuate 3,4-dioxygenase beta subunit [Pedobacter insulae]